MRRDNDPVVDGFFLSTDVDNPFAVPLGGGLVMDFAATYGSALLSSLDILGALGSFTQAGTSTWNFVVSDGGSGLLAVDFGTVTISIPAPVPVPQPFFLISLGLVGIAEALRKHRPRAR